MTPNSIHCTVWWEALAQRTEEENWRGQRRAEKTCTLLLLWVRRWKSLRQGPWRNQEKGKQLTATARSSSTAGSLALVPWSPWGSQLEVRPVSVPLKRKDYQLLTQGVSSCKLLSLSGPRFSHPYKKGGERGWPLGALSALTLLILEWPYQPHPKAIWLPAAAIWWPCRPGPFSNIPTSEGGSCFCFRYTHATLL